MQRGRSVIDDAEFRRLIDEAKKRRNLSDVLGRHTKLRKRNSLEKVGLCPFHKERTPSFEVNDARGIYHCHGCGAAGDHIRALMVLDGLTFRGAYEALTNDTFPTVSEAERARQRKEDERARAAAIADAQFMWRECVSAEGTPAEVYLRDARGISIEIPPAVRFGHVPTSRDEQGNWKRPYPAMVCACTNNAGEIVGLQRVFLRDDGRDKRWGKRSKLSLGRPRGAVVRLSPPGVCPVMCEGPEDGLTLAQEKPGYEIWAALGTAMMPEVELAPQIRRVILAGDNDDAGRAAVRSAAAAIEGRGVDVALWFPRAGFKDFNDQLRGIQV